MTKQIIIEEVVEWIRTRNETTIEDIQFRFRTSPYVAKMVYDLILAKYPHIVSKNEDDELVKVKFALPAQIIDNDIDYL